MSIDTDGNGKIDYTGALQIIIIQIRVYRSDNGEERVHEI